MKFKGITTHQQKEQVELVVLLTNLGSPDAPTASALRRYLKQFLSDPRVVEVPRIIWWFVLRLFILTFRPKKSAKLYQKVWRKEGAPLLFYSQQQQAALQQQLDATLPYKVKVELAMRYGQPSIASVMSRIVQMGVKRLLILPLYPQYSATTTASTLDEINRQLQQWRWIPDIRFVHSYHDDHAYIQALKHSVEQYWQQHGQRFLVMSFHGIPKAYLEKGDPYYCYCHKTARLLAEALQLNDEQWVLTFQSRFGPKEWLQPYTDVTLQSLPAKGISKVNVVCPGFSADCLETLEEIEHENKDAFLQAGGDDYHYIPALNASAQHIDALQQIVKRHTENWK